VGAVGSQPSSPWAPTPGPISASHVAIVGRLRGDPVLFESTTLTDLPDLVTKDPIKGVQCHEIANRVASYNGRIWHYPLTKVLDFTKRRELGRCLWDHHGVAYDVLGALRSGGCLFSWLESLMRVEDLNSIFCSELVAAAYRAVGLLDTDNVSRWSPNRIIRHQIKRGVVAKQGVRLK